MRYSILPGDRVWILDKAGRRIGIGQVTGRAEPGVEPGKPADYFVRALTDVVSWSLMTENGVAIALYPAGHEFALDFREVGLVTITEQDRYESKRELEPGQR